MLNGVPVDALSTILHYSRAFEVGKALCLKLKDTIPKHLFEVAIQVSSFAFNLIQLTDVCFNLMFSLQI